MIPLPFTISPLMKYAAVALAVVGVLFCTYRIGANSVQAKWDLDKAEIREKIVIQKVIEEKITEKIVVEYKDRIKTIVTKGDTIYVKVPEYITAQDNAACPIPNGFVRVWDASIQNELPGPPDDTDRATSEFSLTEVAENAATNYATCHIYKERALAWEQWAREQKEANK